MKQAIIRRVAKSVGSEDPDPGTPMLAQEHFSGAHTFFEPFFRFQEIFFQKHFLVNVRRYSCRERGLYPLEWNPFEPHVYHRCQDLK